VEVELARFADYPYFFAFLEEQLGFVPETAVVRWQPYGDFTKYLIEADDEEQAADIEAWIDEVEHRIDAGEDVPPVVRRDGEIADGRHRSFAAERLGIALAPTIELDEMG
jgi:hypothetical protein